ncbi:MAG TPA: radical SAM protein [Candidatus Polarisedimenticolaceae bacterium]|nr:radical SAM protein [Candidatus Polarisedimenticolaceae bacterium]
MDTILPGHRVPNPPLGLATLAALSPADWEVTIVDENIESLPLLPQADIVGICGMGVQLARQKELLSFYRNGGYYVVAGGSYASLCPEEFDTLADSVIAGEAEYIWKEFCRDYARGVPRRLYRETGRVALADSPVPRFDLLRLDRYQAASLQFSRGCPFRCEFCDVVVMFGREPRTKSPDQVGRELDALGALGVQNVFFVDDNLIGNKRAAKELLAFLADYQRQRGDPFRFGTEASLNLAHDAELLELFRAAGMGWVFIGIESPDEASLKEARKLQNTGQDILASVRTVYAHGIDVLAGFIIGFDHDTVETFERQRRFILDSGVQASMIGLLGAPPKTPLYERLAKEGRIIPGANDTDNTKLGTNVRPKGMTYDQLLGGYRDLHRRLFDDRGIGLRVRNKLRYLRPTCTATRYSLGEALPILRRLLVRGVLPGGVGRIASFLRSLPWTQPRLLPQAVEDWIVGLSMRAYIDRHFERPSEQARRAVRRHVERMEQAFRRYRSAGTLEVALHEPPGRTMSLSLRLRGRLDRGFFEQAGRRLERVLRGSAASVTLHIDILPESHRSDLERLLRRLSRHGDRIRVHLHETLRHLVRVDSSVFDLSLALGPLR